MQTDVSSRAIVRGIASGTHVDEVEVGETTGGEEVVHEGNNKDIDGVVLYAQMMSKRALNFFTMRLTLQ